MPLEAYLVEQSRQGRLNGAVLVRRAGELLLDQGFGSADRTDGRPNTPETAFRIASISKQCTAAAILLLQERGLLSVQDHLSAWVPGSPVAWAPITLHHLLTHTSGIGHWDDLPELSLFAPRAWEQLLPVFQAHPLKFSPGHGWAYSSPAYVLLAHVVEQVAGEPYARFLTHRLFQPLGMARTGAGNQAPHPDEQARGYAGEDTVRSFELDTVGKGAGDVWSTTQDLARWNAALSAPGLLSADSLRAMVAPHAQVPEAVAGVPGIHYGYGWFMGKLEGHRVRFHDGANAGFRAIHLHLLEHAAEVILLANDEHSDVLDICRQLMTAVARSGDSAPILSSITAGKVPLGGAHLTGSKHATRGVCVVHLAPLLIKQLANAPFLRSNLLQVVQTVQKEVAEVGDIGFTLHPQVDHPCTRENTKGHIQQLRPLLGPCWGIESRAQATPRIWGEGWRGIRPHRLHLPPPPRGSALVLLPLDAPGDTGQIGDVGDEGRARVSVHCF
jgi:CubicO group peptidase (beta-lactamase class C family)